ncbi:MAG: lysylphosphatidylglycerol synthase transmembrane domain-containing protein [Bacteroidota bacterium]
MKKPLINVLKFLLFLSIGLGILYLVFQGENAKFLKQCEAKGIPAGECSLIDKIIGDFKGVNYLWILLVFLAFAISNVSRSIRWRMLLRPMGYNPRLINAFFSIMIAYFANLGLPRIGEVIRAGTIAQYEKIPVEKAMGTIVVGRIVDLISMLVVVMLAFLLEFDTLWGYVSENFSAEGFLNFRLFGILAVLGIGGFFLWRFLKDRFKNTAIYQKIANILNGFVEGIQTIRKLDNPGLFILHSINIWVMYYLMSYLCFFAFEPTSHLGPVTGLVVFVFGALGILIPTPGGMGSYQYLVKHALEFYGVSGDDAFSFANILFFSVNIGCNILIGLIALALLPVINASYKPKHQANVAAD